MWPVYRWSWASLPFGDADRFFCSTLVLDKFLYRSLSLIFLPSQIWNHYDSDRSGYLEGEEIDAFLKDMLEQQGSNPSPQRISDYKNFIVRPLKYGTID